MGILGAKSAVCSPGWESGIPHEPWRSLDGMGAGLLTLP